MVNSMIIYCLLLLFSTIPVIIPVYRFLYPSCRDDFARLRVSTVDITRVLHAIERFQRCIWTKLRDTKLFQHYIHLLYSFVRYLKSNQNPIFLHQSNYRLNWNSLSINFFNR